MKIVGHRGAKGLAPENTVASLRKAIELGVDEVEFDLRLTKDGVLVLHHDPALRDQTGKKYRIERFAFKELLGHKPDLATFDEAAQTVKLQSRMLIEIKPGVDPKPVITSVKALLKKTWKPSDMIIASRQFKILRAVHKSLPEVELSVIDRWSGVRATLRARRVGAKRLCMNQLWLWPGFIQALSHDGWQLYAYPLNDPAKARRWSAYGLSGVITDYPDRYKR